MPALRAVTRAATDVLDWRSGTANPWPTGTNPRRWPTPCARTGHHPRHARRRQHHRHRGDASPTHPAARSTRDQGWIRPGCAGRGDRGRAWWRLPLLGHHSWSRGRPAPGKARVVVDHRRSGTRCAFGPSCDCGDRPQGRHGIRHGSTLFTWFTYDNGATLDLLRAVVNVMHRRTNRLRGRTRLHTPTRAEPLFVLIIDEIAALTAYVSDRKTPHRSRTAIGSAALPGPGCRYLRRRRGARSRQRRPAGTAIVHRTGRFTADRSHPNRDGPGPAARDAGASVTRSPMPHPVSATSATTARRTETGPGLPRHRPRHHHLARRSPTHHVAPAPARSLTALGRGSRPAVTIAASTDAVVLPGIPDTIDPGSWSPRWCAAPALESLSPGGGAPNAPDSAPTPSS